MESKINQLFSELKERSSNMRINCFGTSLFLNYLEKNYSEFDNLTVAEFREIINNLTGFCQ